MTVSTEGTYKRYLPGAAQAAEALTGIVFFDPDDLAVYLVSAIDSSEVLLTRDVHYAIGGTGRAAQGTITALADFGANVLHVQRESQRQQPVALEAFVDLPLPEMERQLDKTALVLQEQDRELARVPKVARGAVAPALVELIPDHVLYVDDSGDIRSKRDVLGEQVALAAEQVELAKIAQASSTEQAGLATKQATRVDTVLGAIIAGAPGGFFETPAAGLAASAEGGYFTVPETGAFFARLYRKVLGVATGINTLVSAAAFRFVTGVVGDGIADDGPAILAYAAGLTADDQIRLPRGKYRFNSSASIIPILRLDPGAMIDVSHDPAVKVTAQNGYLPGGGDYHHCFKVAQAEQIKCPKIPMDYVTAEHFGAKNIGVPVDTNTGDVTALESALRLAEDTSSGTRQARSHNVKLLKGGGYFLERTYFHNRTAVLEGDPSWGIAGGGTSLIVKDGLDAGVACFYHQSSGYSPFAAFGLNHGGTGSIFRNFDIVPQTNNGSRMGFVSNTRVEVDIGIARFSEVGCLIRAQTSGEATHLFDRADFAGFANGAPVFGNANYSKIKVRAQGGKQVAGANPGGSIAVLLQGNNANWCDIDVKADDYGAGGVDDSSVGNLWKIGTSRCVWSVGHNGVIYACIKAHNPTAPSTLPAVTEPGVGSDWMRYWRINTATSVANIAWSNANKVWWPTAPFHASDPKANSVVHLSYTEGASEGYAILRDRCALIAGVASEFVYKHVEFGRAVVISYNPEARTSLAVAGNTEGPAGSDAGFFQGTFGPSTYTEATFIAWGHAGDTGAKATAPSAYQLRYNPARGYDFRRGSNGAIPGSGKVAMSLTSAAFTLGGQPRPALVVFPYGTVIGNLTDPLTRSVWTVAAINKADVEGNAGRYGLVPKGTRFKYTDVAIGKAEIGVALNDGTPGSNLIIRDGALL